MTKTAIIYARVSSEEQQDNGSLPSQLKACRDYCAKNGYSVVAEYAESFTGTTLNRPQLNEVAKLAGTFDVLITNSSDRLSRDTVDLLVFNQQLKAAGTLIEYLVNPVDGSTNLGEAMLALQGYAAKEWRRGMLEALARGRVERVQSGKVMVAATPPYGYDYDREAGKLVINESRAAVVRNLFEWYVYGDESGKRLSANAIAKKLDAVGVPTARANSAYKYKPAAFGWSVSTVINMLKNETYIGRWYYGTYQKRRRPNDTELIVVSVPAIIDRELFALAQQQAQRNKANASRNAKREYLLRGRCKCAKCGYRLSGSTHNGISYFRCHHRYHRCGGSVRMDVLEAVVWETVKEFLKSPDLIMVAIQEERVRLDAEMKTVQVYLETCEQQLVELEQYRHNLMSDYSRRRISDDFYDRELPQVEQQIAEYRAKIVEYQQQLAQADNLPTEADINAICLNTGNLDNATVEVKARILEAFNVQCVVDRDKKHVAITTFLHSIANKIINCHVHNCILQFTVTRQISA